MAKDEKVVVKGGFRSTLALIISIVAIVLAVFAYNRSGGNPDLNAQIKSLQGKLESMKEETSKQVEKVRDETAGALEKLSQSIRTKGK